MICVGGAIKILGGTGPEEHQEHWAVVSVQMNKGEVLSNIGYLIITSMRSSLLFDLSIDFEDLIFLLREFFLDSLQLPAADFLSFVG